MMFDHSVQEIRQEGRHDASLLHRLPTSVKFILLFLVSVALFYWPTFWFICLILVCVLGLYPVAGFSLSTPLHHSKPLLLLIGMLFVFNLIYAGWMEAAIIVLRLACLFLLANLVTLTTSLSLMMECFERCFVIFKPFGLNPIKMALVFSLTLRFIPLLNRLVWEVRQAQAARGLERSFLSLFIPVIIAMLKMSEEIANAIEARGFDA